jgi:hypothetical protein
MTGWEMPIHYLSLPSTYGCLFFTIVLTIGTGFL